MRKVVALLPAVMLFCGTAWGASYPELGVCTGDRVRLRESPGTKGKIVGQVDTGRHLVILGTAKSGGQTWYKVDHSDRKGTAYIISGYVKSCYRLPLEEEFVRLRLDFGVSPAKTKVLLGRNPRVLDEGFEYPGVMLWYHGNMNISRIQVAETGCVLKAGTKSSKQRKG